MHGHHAYTVDTLGRDTLVLYALVPGCEEPVEVGIAAVDVLRCVVEECIYVCLLVLGTAGIEQCKELFDELIHRQSLEAVELFAQFAWEQGGDIVAFCSLF